MALYEVNIDFDLASQMWRQNKQNIGNGYFKYICCSINKNGLSCNNKPNYGLNYCLKHLSFKDNEETFNKNIYKSEKKTKNYNKNCIMLNKNGNKCKKISMNGLDYCFSHKLK